MKKENLHNIKDTGFKTPDNYFETFEAQLEERLAEENTVLDIELTGFSVPKDYFDTVENNLMYAIKTENNKHVITLKPRRILYYSIGIAASLVLMLSIIINNKSSLSIDSIDTVAIESYLYQEDYTNTELASLFNAEEISETDFIDFNVSEETLDQYLDNIDTEDLILD